MLLKKYLFVFIAIITLSISTYGQWYQIEAFAPGDWTEAYAIEIYDSNSVAFSVSPNKIYFTLNGIDWDLVTLEENAYDIEMISRTEVLASTEKGNIYKIDLVSKTENLVFENNTSTTSINYIEIFEDGSGVAMGGSLPTASHPLLLRTEDFGDSWKIGTPPEFPLSTFDYWRKVDFVDSQTGFYQPREALSDGIFKTANGGENWEKVDSFKVKVLKFYDENFGIAVSEGYHQNTILKSVNGGADWDTAFVIRGAGVGVDFEFIEGDVSKIYFLEKESLYQSSDSGNSWLGFKLPAGAEARDAAFLNESYGFILAKNGALYHPDTSINPNYYFVYGYELDTNRIYMQISNKGTLGRSDLTNELTTYEDMPFLYDGGFYISGFTDEKLWAAGQAFTSLVENFVSGPVGVDEPGIWLINKSDKPFGEGWKVWESAVDYGAPFYDGNNDGKYEPIDLNNNGVWDENEDAPEIIGDKTVWTIYNDGVPGSERDRFIGVNPLGIEISQTAFAYDREYLENAIFVRYKIKNTGLVSDTLKDVIFSAFSDPDIGDATDDLVGVDTIRNAALVYNSNRWDDYIEFAPPALMIPVLNGPAKYIPGETFTDANNNDVFDEGIDIPLDSAKFFRGELREMEIIPGAKNFTPSSSMFYISSDPDLGDPDKAEEARNYMEGRNRLGEYIDPCSFPYADVKGGINCEDVNPLFVGSGDPVSQTGWINNTSTDYRTILNVGEIRSCKKQTGRNSSRLCCRPGNRQY